MAFVPATVCTHWHMEGYPRRRHSHTRTRTRSRTLVYLPPRYDTDVVPLAVTLPTLSKVKQYTTFANECNIVAADCLTEAEVQLTFKSEHGPGSKMTFTGFLNTLAGVRRRAR